MVRLYRVEDGKPLGEITDEQLMEMKEYLEEEDSDDTDYYIDHDTIDYLEEKGVDRDLIAFLRRILGDEDFIEICYET